MSTQNKNEFGCLGQLVGIGIFILFVTLFISSDGFDLPTGGLHIYHMKGLLIGLLVIIGLVGLIKRDQ